MSTPLSATDAKPDSLRGFELPRRTRFHSSPADWRDEVLYFLLPDRFSDGGEPNRPLLDRRNLGASRALPNGQAWRWDRWARSGAERFQGGTIRGIRSKLGYLKQLGVSTLWIGPVFKQRRQLNTYHGYGIQDFLDVDSRFGTRQDLVDLVASAHAKGLRIILDVIFNHSGSNWVYGEDAPGGRFKPRYTMGRYPFGSWLGGNEAPAPPSSPGTPPDQDDAVLPVELQDPERYTRAGKGDLRVGDIGDPQAEHKRSDFEDLRDFRLDAGGLLSDLARCYKYWIALTDCDGFRIDTVKHVTFEEARNFCGTIKEFAANLGKSDFFLVGEIAGGDENQQRYTDALDRNLNATLDIGEMRLALGDVAKGLRHPSAYFDGFLAARSLLGSHRNLGQRHVSILDDHDHVSGEKIRFSTDAASDHQVVAAVALQLFTLGIPCIYYGTEQALGGPEASEREWLPGWKTSDQYLREAMFGPAQALADAGTAADEGSEAVLPGFGPFGTVGHHCFDPSSSAYVRIAALTALRRRLPVLRSGRQYLRPTSFLGRPFAVHGPGELMAWSRILDDEEAVCMVNPHGTESRGADVLVDASLSAVGSSMTVVANTAQAANSVNPGHLVGSTVRVERRADGIAFLAVRDVGPSETVVLTNRP